MTRLADVSEFAERLSGINTASALSALVDDFAREMGFRHFAIVHHVDHRIQRGRTALIHNYPSGWVEHFRQKALYYVDPVFHASERAVVGFFWASIPRLLDVTEQQRNMLEAAAKHGIADGFTIPVHVPGEPLGSCSFVAPRTGKIAPETRLQAQLAGQFAFDAARRLVIARNGGLGRKVPMTERQRECVILAARGKADNQIAKELGVGIETVKMHLRAARQRYGVSKRMTLAVRALQDGQISFSEVLSALPPLGEWADDPHRS